MKKIAVILAGCGVKDGAEIHEATMALLAIKKNGADYQIFAPDRMQHHVVNHLTDEEMPEQRNILIEAARIARGNIKDINELDMNEFDALVMPGGFGAAKNLCNFAFKGEDFEVFEDVKRVILQAHELKKPIGALCIAPVMLVKVLGDIKFTIGQDKATAEMLEKLGAKHQKTSHGEVSVDEKNLVFTTPCYMLDATILDIATGAENLINKMMSYL